jgi:hypothetical protein
MNLDGIDLSALIMHFKEQGHKVRWFDFDKWRDVELLVVHTTNINNTNFSRATYFNEFELRNKFPIIRNPYNTFRNIMNKDETYVIMEENGECKITNPDAVLPESIEMMKKFLYEYGCPIPDEHLCELTKASFFVFWYEKETSPKPYWYEIKIAEFIFRSLIRVYWRHCPVLENPLKLWNYTVEWLDKHQHDYEESFKNWGNAVTATEEIRSEYINDIINIIES